MRDSGRRSRRLPVLRKVAPSVLDLHLKDGRAAGRVIAIQGETMQNPGGHQAARQPFPWHPPPHD
ncbi:MAG TPA: hypothetical protein VGM32_02675 [Rhodopila sp.]